MRNLISEDIEAISSRVNTVLKDFPQIAGAYLFGSTLGKCRPDSDIDLGLVLEDSNMSDKEQEQLETAIAYLLGTFNNKHYDITFVSPQSPIFSYRIIKDGCLIYVKNMDRITDIIEDVSRRYSEVYPRYRAALEDILSEVI